MFLLFHFKIKIKIYKIKFDYLLHFICFIVKIHLEAYKSSIKTTNNMFTLLDFYKKIKNLQINDVRNLK